MARRKLDIVEVITLSDDDDCVDQGKGHKDTVQDIGGDDDFFLVRMRNLPSHCSEKAIVEYFHSDENGESVNVYLGTDGVLTRTSGFSTMAFTVFRGIKDFKKALTKNLQAMGTTLVDIAESSPEELMKEFSMSARSNVANTLRSCIMLNNVPSIASLEDVEHFLCPFQAWIQTDGKHYRQFEKDESFGYYVMTMISEMAAFFVMMKKHGMSMKVRDSSVRIQIKMCGYTVGETEEKEPDMTKLTEKYSSESFYSPSTNEVEGKDSRTGLRSFLPYNFVRRHPNIRAKGIIRLINLPPYTNQEDLLQLFGRRVMMQPNRIQLHREGTIVEACIEFSSISAAQLAVDNIRSFCIGSYQVEVQMFSYSEEY